MHKFYIFRHGETDWNVQKRYQGQTDIPLNKNGQDQALTLAKHFAELSLIPDIIVSSDLQRAAETAQIIQAHLSGEKKINLDIQYTPKLRECSLGIAEGKKYIDIDKELDINKEDKSLFERWSSIDPLDMNFSFPGGETKSEHLRRMQNFLEGFVSKYPEYKNIAVSSHGASMRRLVHASFNAPDTPIPIENCTLVLLEYDHRQRWHYVKL